MIIMTSNIGQEFIQHRGSIGFSRPLIDKTEGLSPKLGKADKEDAAYKGIKEKLLGEVKKAFRPEFLNRIDDIIVFHPLTRGDIEKIVGIEIEPVYKKLAELGIHLEISEKVKNYLAEKGFDPNFGARPLKRAIQKYIQDPLSLKFLNGSLKEGADIAVDLDKGQDIIFK